MKGISAGLAAAVLLFAAAPAAAEPGNPGPNFPEPTSFHSSQHDVEADGTVAIVLGGVLLFVAVAAPLFGAESRPAWRRVDRKPSFRMVGSMRPEDWPPREFKR
jgi:hypothetical protein